MKLFNSILCVGGVLVPPNLLEALGARRRVSGSSHLPHHFLLWAHFHPELVLWTRCLAVVHGLPMLGHDFLQKHLSHQAPIWGSEEKWWYQSSKHLRVEQWTFLFLEVPQSHYQLAVCHCPLNLTLGFLILCSPPPPFGVLSWPNLVPFTN